MRRNVVILIRNAASYDFGGGERVPVFIAREVEHNSDLCPIVFSRSAKLLDFAKANGVEHRRTWWWGRQNWSGARVLLIPIYLLWQLVLCGYYVVLFIRYRPSVVHLQSKDDFIAGTFAARLLNIRVLWSDYADLKHIFMNHRVWYKNPIGKLVYFAAHFTETIIVVSNEDKRLICVHLPDGVIREKMQVIYYGAFDTYKKHEKHEVFTFVSSSRIVTDKGIKELIEAFNMFHAKHPESNLHILGDGPERESFESMAKANPAIIFLGHQTKPLEYVTKAHVFIIPTYHEGFSIALVEACMLGMPIIATSVGGNGEIIHDMKTGLLVPVRDSIALYEAMEKLYSDSSLRIRLGQQARAQYLDLFVFDRIVKERLIPLYETAD